MSTDRRWRAVPVLAAMVVLASACTIPVRNEAAPTSSPVVTAEQPPEVFPSPVFPTAIPDDGSLDESFTAMAASTGARIGVAYAPVGVGDVSTLGEVTGGSAWSTIKVPLVVAAEQNSPDSAAQWENAAITTSDNESAEMLWSQLGSDEAASSAVQSVLADAGDSSTTVPSVRQRGEYSIFGQTQWSLDNQVRFAAGIACDPAAAGVIELMSNVDPSQQWGLGRVSGSAFKGGWGPDTAGNYLVRQFGIVSSVSGQFAIAVAAEPDSGTFDDGIAALNTVAQWVDSNLGELPSGQCA